MIIVKKILKMLFIKTKNHIKLILLEAIIFSEIMNLLS